MRLLSSHHLLAFSAVHRRRHSSATTTTTTHLHRYKPTTTTDTVRFPCSPVVPAVLRLGERVSVSAFVVSANAHDLLHNAGATVGVLGGAYTLVFAFDDLTRRKIIKQGSNSPSARYFAAFVPLVNCLRLLVNGFSLTSDEGLIKSVTREGDPRELLRGPLCYVLILILCALAFWRESPIGVVSLAMMCGGDGVADIIGRRYGSMKIPYNPQKSWAGSISMLMFGFLVSIGMLYYYSVLGHVQLDWGNAVPRVAFVAIVATVVESLPISEVVDDNLSVPLITMAVACFAFPH
ncbi:probable phytol kinase 1, chloroplastic isoform X2 [Lotus japonicus]|uniref:probable phytol kinase 1, chloroplastic isoform X2 n=1 Tax=Lotus japonicus TaxID=34305 RepID=UPI00259030EE|nr:probable phytol kinase 1, chloroplastic isoform X2 [Lotus japonicus]